MDQRTECSAAQSALLESLGSDAPLAQAHRRHVHDCEMCRRLLDRAHSLEEDLRAGMPGDASEADSSAIEAEVVAVSEKRFRRRVASALLILATYAAALSLLLTTGGSLAPPQILVLSLVLTLAVVVPVAVLVAVRRAVHSSRTVPIYRRLGSRWQLLGVCRGIAERMNVPVALVRVAFVFVFLFEGAGLVFYLLLGLILPVHPADRQHLLRFRIARRFRRTAVSERG